MYFTGDVDAKDRIRSLNEFNKTNLNEMRTKSVQDSISSILYLKNSYFPIKYISYTKN